MKMHELTRLKRHYNTLIERHKKAEKVKPKTDDEWATCIATYKPLRKDLNETLEAIRGIEEVSASEIINGFKEV